jgi:hypothetical protein
MGQRNLDTVTALAIEVAQAALAAGHTKILLDVTGLEGRLGLLDNYLVVGSVLEGLRGNGLLRGAIVDREMHSLRGWVLETIARNRGFDLRLFTSHDAAIRWLEEP